MRAVAGLDWSQKSHYVRYETFLISGRKRRHGAKSTLDGVDTQGLKKGDTLKGSALLEKAGQAPSADKGALPGSIPKPSWK
jgi:hypothetical protein